MYIILGAIFLIIILHVYNIIGHKVIQIFKFKERGLGKDIIYGYLTLLFFQWIIAFPIQYLHLSWQIYVVIQSVIYITIILFCMKGRSYCVVDWRKAILRHIKDYYLLYIFATCFTIFSMASQLPYLEMNYDDPFYLGSIIRSIGSPSLGLIDYQTGSYAPLDLIRTMTTFHMNYAYFSELFHIEPVFFTRCIMTFHNYLIVFLAFTMFFSRYVKKANYSQYVIVAFSFLLIPAGFLETNSISRMYDGWQLNTAIWYGGSIVRLISIPILLTVGNEVVTNFSTRKLFYYIMICISFLSLSSIIVPFVFFTSMILFFSYIIHKTKNSKENWKRLIAWMVIIIVLLSIMILPKIISHISPSYGAELQASFESFKPFRILYTRHNNILYVGVTALLISIIIFKDFNKRMLSIQCLLICFICFTALYDKFIIIASMGYFFVGLRFLTGALILLIGYCGLLFVKILENINIKYINPIIGVYSVVFISNFNIQHLDEYKNIDYLGSGLIKQGFDFSRLISKDSVKPSIITDLQYYLSNEFNTLKRVIAPSTIEWNRENLLLNAQLSFVDANLENCSYAEGCDIEISDRAVFDGFLNNDTTYDEIKSLLKKYDIQYAIVSQLKYDEKMQEHHLEIKFEMQDDNGVTYYLIAL